MEIVLFYKRLERVGGAEKLLVREWQNLNALGHEVVIVTYMIDEECKKLLSASKVKSVTIRRHWLVARVFRLAWYLVKSKPKYILGSSGHIDLFIAGLLTNRSYSLHIHHPIFMSMNDMDKYSLIYRRVFDEVTEESEYGDYYRSRRSEISVVERIGLEVRAFMHHLAVVHAKHIFVLSQYAKNEKERLYGVTSIVLRGAIEAVLVEGYSRLSQLSDYRLIYIGRLAVDKRIDLIIKATRVLIDANQRVKLTIVGKGPDEIRLKSLSRQYGLDNIVSFEGFTEEERVKELLEESNCFVSPDCADFRLTAFEALNSGRPVLLSNESDEDAELIETGYLELVEPTVEGIVGGLKRIKERINRKECDTDRLREYLEKLTWKQYFCKVYRTLEEGF